MKRDEVIKTVAGLVGNPHVVDLTQPDKCILIQVFKSICGISVVENFYNLKRFNVENLDDKNT